MNGDTVFEIGSVTKVFTALLLSDMARKGEVKLEDPVTKYLPTGAKVPGRNGRAITLLDLATHTAGLPFMPDDLPVYGDVPKANYSLDRIFQFLSRYKLTRDPGKEWVYSNLDYWLLGKALTHKAGTDYEHILRKRILGPLQMKDTEISGSPKLRAEHVVGYNAALQPAPAFNNVSVYASMPEAGGLVSNVNDLLSFLAVSTGNEKSVLSSSFEGMLTTRRTIDDTREQALGWVVVGKGNDQLVAHDGSTWGFSSYVAWDPATHVGVVVLSNQLGGISDIGRHLLRPQIPLEATVSTKHREIPMEPSLLDRYNGDYSIAGEGVFSVVREQSVLTFQMPASWGVPKLHLAPESDQDFFAAELPFRVKFQMDSNQRVAGLMLFPPRTKRPLTGARMPRVVRH
jgi:serine-type D-Ala-D-Ala carboxypeptidase/endopeptidase